MRPCCVLIVCLLASALSGCIALPALDFSVRSTWRQRPDHDGRGISVLAGVLLGWSGASRPPLPATVADNDGEQVADNAPPNPFGDDTLSCTSAALCRWEEDERSAALIRAGAQAELEWP